jgi:hypothetical protein
MEPSFFAFADAQQTLVDCTAPIVADGGDNGGHSPATNQNVVSSMNEWSAQVEPTWWKLDRPARHREMESAAGAVPDPGASLRIPNCKTRQFNLNKICIFVWNKKVDQSGQVAIKRIFKKIQKAKNLLTTF